MFLVCGDVTIRILSACRHASLKLKGIVVARMSPKCSINNINIVAKFYESPYLIYKKEQYRSSIYSKMINIYILSVYSPFSDRVGLPLHNIHNPSPFTSIMDVFFVDLKFGHIHFYTL